MRIRQSKFENRFKLHTPDYGTYQERYTKRDLHQIKKKYYYTHFASLKEDLHRVRVNKFGDLMCNKCNEKEIWGMDFGGEWDKDLRMWVPEPNKFNRNRKELVDDNS